MYFPELSDEDLKLVMLDTQHAKGYSDILSDPGTFHFLTDSGPVDEHEARLKIEARRKAFFEGSAIYWAITGFEHDFLGFVAIHNFDQELIAISYGIHPVHRRKGIVYKAMKMVLSWNRLKGKKLEIATHEENTASFGLLMKLGLTYAGLQFRSQGKRHIFISDLVPTGEMED